MKTAQLFKFVPLALLSIFGIIFTYSIVGNPKDSFVYKVYADGDLFGKLSNEDTDGKQEKSYKLLTIENSSIEIYRWPNDTLCSNYSVKFGKNLDAAWLLSYPRSGNTWIRYLIESATGIFTGSIYKERSLKGLGFIGEIVRFGGVTTIVVKTHRAKSLKGSDKKSIIIIRNPARSIISFWNFNTYKGSRLYWTKSVANTSYTTRAFHNFVEKALKNWMLTYTDPLKYTKKLHVVFYEMLREDPLREIRGILRFLELLPDEGRLLCLSRHLEGVFKGPQREVEPYTSKEKKAFTSAIKEINVLLRSRGFPPLPDYKKYGLV